MAQFFLQSATNDSTSVTNEQRAKTAHTTGGSGQLQLNKLSKFHFFLQDEDEDQLCVDYVM